MGAFGWIPVLFTPAKLEAKAASEVMEQAAEVAAVLKAQTERRPSRGSDAGVLLHLDLEGRIGIENRLLSCKMDLMAGEVSCVMGPSGIGKSTLLKIVND